MRSPPPTLPLLRDDAQLVHACRQGDHRAWEQLVRRYERLIYTIPRRARLGADDAADVFQAVFQRLHEHLDRLQQPERLQAWLVTTARRETLRLLRERGRTVALTTADDDQTSDAPPPDLVDPDPLPDAVIEELQQRQRVRRALEALSAPCRSLFTLLYCENEPVPYAQISAQLNVPEGSIGPTRARCLAKRALPARTGSERRCAAHRLPRAVSQRQPALLGVESGRRRAHRA
jgi:RNA polymerase sigma factor (sigma-70 family)